MPLIETKGAASAQGFGEFLQQGQVNYIEDVFSTWLYTGNGSTQTITNGIDLSGKGGLVWIKPRTSTTFNDNILFDTARGANVSLFTNSTAGNDTNSIGSFNSNGFSLTGSARNNASTVSYASWTFRKQAKFFDVVTWTGNGVNQRVISHSLGSDVGAIIVKRTDTTSNWQFAINVSGGSSRVLRLNTTEAAYPTTANMLDNGYASITGFYTPSNTGFALINGSTNFSQVNANGGTYVAYLFAHNAGGFGLTGSDNVISCGSYTGNGSATGPTITLGYEPQWLMIKNASGTGNWNIIDNMRGMPVGSADAFLEANTSDAEATADWVSPTATGFNIVSTSSEVNTNTSTYIYIAIRRGPMKVPTSGTSVYSGVLRNGTNATGSVTSPNFAPDAIFSKAWGNTVKWAVNDKLRGVASTTRWLSTNTTDAEEALSSSGISAYTNTGYTLAADSQYLFNASGYTNYVDNVLLRAPGFFDEVCYTGNGGTQNVSHNLTVAPEMIIVKARGLAESWVVQAYPALAASKVGVLNNNIAFSDNSQFDYTAPTSAVFTVGSSGNTNDSGARYVAYLFASVNGVSKVGSYTGTGALQTINCGFTGGARFVLIKRTDSTGDWYVYNSARGISSGNDPYVLINSNAQEVTTTNYVDTDTTGFKVTAAAPAGLNASGGTYIFLAIA